MFSYLIKCQTKDVEILYDSICVQVHIFLPHCIPLKLHYHPSRCLNTFFIKWNYWNVRIDCWKLWNLWVEIKSKYFFFQCVFQSHNLHLSASYHLTQSVEYLVFLFEKYGMCSIDCKAFSSSSQIKVFNRFIYNSNYNLRHLLEKLELPSKLDTHYRWDNVIKLNKIDIIKFVFMDLIKKHSCRIVDAGKNISMST